MEAVIGVICKDANLRNSDIIDFKDICTLKSNLGSLYLNLFITV